MVKFDKKRRNLQSACFPIGNDSEFVIGKLTDSRFTIMTKAERGVDSQRPADGIWTPMAGWRTEINREQIGAVILALMQVQQIMTEGRE